MPWQDFKQAAPELAALGEELFERTGLVLLGSLRKEGFPRISPVEILFDGGHLYLGMMWRSRKALDLLRDPRCTLHSATSHRDGSQGDFKVYGRAVEIHDLEMRRHYGEALFLKIGMNPEGSEYHLFSIDVESVALVEFKDEKMTNRVWKAEQTSGLV